MLEEVLGARVQSELGWLEQVVPPSDQNRHNFLDRVKNKSEEKDQAPGIGYAQARNGKRSQEPGRGRSQTGSEEQE